MLLLSPSDTKQNCSRRLLRVGRPLLLIAGSGATATIWTPDLLQTLAQGRQVTIFTNRGIGLSQTTVETQIRTVAGDYCFL